MSGPPLIQAVISTDVFTSTETLKGDMPHDTSLDIFYSMPPSKPRPQSIYKRFKDLLVASNTENDLPATFDIKNHWEGVKAVDVDAVSPDCRTQSMTFKHLAELHMMEEDTRYEAELSKWCHSFDEAATRLLVISTREASVTNFLQLESVISRVEVVSEQVWKSRASSNFSEHLRYAKKQFSQITKAYEPKLFAYLRQAEDQELLNHCCDHANLQSELKTKTRDHDDLFSELQMLAKAIPYEIINGMERQLRPTGGAISKEGIMIAYSRAGVSPKVFALAFDVPPHITTVLIRAPNVGSRQCRESSLFHSDIRVSYDQTKLTATAIFQSVYNTAGPLQSECVQNEEFQSY